MYSSEFSSMPVEKGLIEKMLKLMRAQVVFSKKYGLPLPDHAFRTTKEWLAGSEIARADGDESEFVLAVCGNAGCGKSTLLNALIGRELLPLATSVPYRIRHSCGESIHCVYSDQSVKEISYGHRSHHGTRRRIDEKDFIRSAQHAVLSSVDVKVPLTSISETLENVCIVDTPGIGSAQTWKSALAQQIACSANAVLYVLRSDKTITLSEIAFLKKIFERTPHVFFLSTFTDLVSVADREAVEEYNKEVIEKLSSSRFNFARINSRELIRRGTERAANASRSVFVRDLKQFYLHAEEQRRVKQTIVASEQFNNLLINDLRSRWAALSASVLERRAQQKRLRKEEQLWKQSSYEDNCARFGYDFDTRVQTETEKRLHAQFDPQNGVIICEFKKEIDKLTERHIQTYVNSIPSLLRMRVEEAWLRTYEQMCSKTDELMCQYLGRYDSSIERIYPRLPIRYAAARGSKGSTLFFQSCRLIGNIVDKTSGVLSMYSSMGAAPSIHIGAILASIAYGVFFSVVELFSDRAAGLRLALSELKEKMKDEIASIYHQILSVPLHVDYHGYGSLFENSSLWIKTNALKQIQSIQSQHMTMLQTRRADVSLIGDSEHQRALDDITRHLDELACINEEIVNIRNKIR